MFMEPIEIATAALEPAPRSNAKVFKLVVGLIFLAVCSALMLPWALLMAVWFGVAATMRAFGGLARESLAILRFSGETVLGR